MRDALAKAWYVRCSVGSVHGKALPHLKIPIGSGTNCGTHSWLSRVPGYRVLWVRPSRQTCGCRRLSSLVNLREQLLWSSADGSRRAVASSTSATRGGVARWIRLLLERDSFSAFATVLQTERRQHSYQRQSLSGVALVWGLIFPSKRQAVGIYNSRYDSQGTAREHEGHPNGVSPAVDCIAESSSKRWSTASLWPSNTAAPATIKRIAR